MNSIMTLYTSWMIQSSSMTLRFNPWYMKLPLSDVRTCHSYTIRCELVKIQWKLSAHTLKSLMTLHTSWMIWPLDSTPDTLKWYWVLSEPATFHKIRCELVKIQRKWSAYTPDFIVDLKYKLNDSKFLNDSYIQPLTHKINIGLCQNLPLLH